MKFILAVLFTLAIPFTASAQYYRFDPNIQQRSQDMMQQQQQLEQQQQQITQLQQQLQQLMKLQK